MNGAPSPPPGAIEVETSFMALAFLLNLVKTRVSIDGAGYELPWGKNAFPVHPGRHRVRVSFRYLFGDVGGNEIDVDVTSGQTVHVRYRAPWLVLLKGKLSASTYGYGAAVGSVAPPAPPAVPAAGWFPDPGARHELRYWDGAAWTDHVSDHGTTSTDPAGNGGPSWEG